MPKNHSMHVKSDESTKSIIQANASAKGFTSISEFLRWRGTDTLDLKIEMALAEIKQSVEEIRSAITDKRTPKYKYQGKKGYEPINEDYAEMPYEPLHQT